MLIINKSLTLILVISILSCIKNNTFADEIDLSKNNLPEEKSDLASPIDRRIAFEQEAKNNPFLILPHRPSYFMPISYNDRPNDISLINGNTDASLDKQEAKFQISFKIPLWENIFKEKKNGSLYFAYTQLSLWQLYNSDLSSPFRDNNYEPEIFLSLRTDFDIIGFKNRILNIGFVHQSNGQSEPLSRSWNRLYLDFILEKDNWVISAKPWYRIPENRNNDDNPDIRNYLGHAEFRTAYRYNKQVFSCMLRNNFDLNGDNRSATELAWSFPINGKLRAYIQYFNGYGETLLDYNHSVNRIGIGLSMTSWL